jgi:hypothetical protein
MKDDWKEDAEVLAAGASCPAPECGEINFTYHTANRDRWSVSNPFEFKCSRCGTEFATFDENLLFHSVRREWLWAGNHSA